MENNLPTGPINENQEVTIDINAVNTADVVLPTQVIEPVIDMSAAMAAPEAVIQQEIAAAPIVAQVPTPPEVELSEDKPDNGPIIADIKSAYWGGLLKVLDIVASGTGSDDELNITKGKLIINKNNGILQTDLTSLFNSNTLNLLNPLMQLKILKLITGEDGVRIIENDNQYIAYNHLNGEYKTVCKINKPSEDLSKIPIVATKLLDTDLKHTENINLDTLTMLTTAHSNLGNYNYTVIIDATTHELININIDGKIGENFRAQTGRETIELKVQELFPANKPTECILKVYKIGEEFHIETITNIGITSLFFQIHASIVYQDAGLDFDSM